MSMRSVAQKTLKYDPNSKNMNKIISIILLGLGLVIIIYGVSMAEPLRNDFKQLVTGLASQQSLWLVITGAVISLIGVIGMRRKKQAK